MKIFGFSAGTWILAATVDGGYCVRLGGVKLVSRFSLAAVLVLCNLHGAPTPRLCSKDLRPERGKFQ